MTIPDWRTLTVPQLILVAGAAVLVLSAIVAVFSGRKSGGTGLAVWAMAPFFLAVAGGAVWLLIHVMKLIGPDF
jgi:hypothetical protein